MRRAWITGASSGLGRALALKMAAEGWQVAASARSADALDTLAKEAEALNGRILPLALDVTDREAVNEAAEHLTADFGLPDLAVLNAGTHKPTPADSFSAEDLRSLIELNLMGCIHCLEVLLPPMRARGSGQIALVASLAGYFGLPPAGGYGLTKAGLINLAEALHPELEAEGILLQVVNPGFVKTPLTDLNDFPMPFLMGVEDAAAAFYKGLMGRSFEIVFPRRFAFLLKVLRLLPYPLSLALTRRLVAK